MFISVSKFSILLLFVHSVISVDFNKNREVSQERLKRDDTYNLNHPPLNDAYETIPLTKTNDYEEKEGVEFLSGSSDSPYDLKVNKNDQDIKVSKPRARSLNINTPEQEPVVKDKPLDSLRASSVGKNQNDRRRVQRKRLQQVRKINENQVETTLGISETTTVKTLLKDNIVTTQKTAIQKTDNVPQKLSTSTNKRTRTRDPVVPIVESENYVFAHRGNFHYSYEGGDGTRASERGELKQFEEGGAMGEAVVGSFSYTDNDGNEFSLSYTADENGYRPVGAHLPTPPPIPPEIQAALRLLATKTTPEPITERISKSS